MKPLALSAVAGSGAPTSTYLSPGTKFYQLANFKSQIMGNGGFITGDYSDQVIDLLFPVLQQRLFIVVFELE